MAFENGALNSNLAAAVGDDPLLIVELHAAFLESAKRQLNLLERARCDGNWHFAALRLKGLAASFGVAPLMDLADEAVDAAPGDPVVVNRIRRLLDNLATPD